MAILAIAETPQIKLKIEGRMKVTEKEEEQRAVAEKTSSQNGK